MSEVNRHTARNARSWWLLLICGFVELGLGFWAAGSWNASVVVLVSWGAAAALVHGIGDIALGFHNAQRTPRRHRHKGLTRSRVGEELVSGG